MSIVVEFYKYTSNIFFNTITVLLNIFIRRDRKIIIFSGWSGARFSGNPRYLFQYCYENMHSLGFERVIWVSRDKKIVDELRTMGYESHRVHSVRSYYLHLKAGIHVIGGSYTITRTVDGLKPADMLTTLSWGAVHIIMSHAASWTKRNVLQEGNDRFSGGMIQRLTNWYRILYQINWLRHFVLVPGGWDDSIRIGKRQSTQSNNPNEKFILAGFPQMCGCLKYTSDEKTLLERIINSNRRIILYTPTYRKIHHSMYIPPLDNPHFCSFIRDNGYFWIEKLHMSAGDHMLAKAYDPEYSLLLDKNFDINVLCENSDLFVTDYSSTYQKAIWYDKPYAFYACDYEQYMTEDIGANQAFLDFVGDGFCKDCRELMDDITEKMQPGYVKKHREFYNKWKNIYFDVEGTDYKYICDKLFGSII